MISAEILEQIVGHLSAWGHTERSGGMLALVPVFLAARGVSREWRRAVDYRWLGDMVLSVGGAFDAGGLWGSVAGQWIGGRSPPKSRYVDRRPWDATVFADVDHLLAVVVPYSVSVLLRVRADALAGAGGPETCPVRHCVASMPLRTLFIIIVSRVMGTSAEGFFLRSMLSHIQAIKVRSIIAERLCEDNAAPITRSALCDRIAALVSTHVEAKRARFGDGALGTMGQPAKVLEAARACLLDRVW